MFDVGGGELIFIVLIFLLLFGPKKIPEFAKMVKRGLGEVRKAQSAFRQEIDNVGKDIKESSHITVEEKPKREDKT